MRLIGEHMLSPFEDVEFLRGADGVEELLRVLNRTALVVIPVNEEEGHAELWGKAVDLNGRVLEETVLDLEPI